MAETRSNSAKLVEKIVVGYAVHSLPSVLVRSFTLLRGKLARAGFKIEVDLCPLTQLPAGTDLLLVLGELEETAREAAPPGVRVVPLIASTAHQPAYDELVTQLREGRKIYAFPAEAEDEYAEAERGDVVRYRGYMRI